MGHRWGICVKGICDFLMLYFLFFVSNYVKTKPPSPKKEKEIMTIARKMIKQHFNSIKRIISYKWGIPYSW